LIKALVVAVDVDEDVVAMVRPAQMATVVVVAVVMVAAVVVDVVVAVDVMAMTRRFGPPSPS
jgi:predicted RNA methylase